jgi:alanyl-tRNA synthetase
MPQSISCDAGVMKKVTQGVQSGNPPDFSFLVICPDQPSSKLKCFAAVSESAVNEYGFSAAKWVDAVTNSLGGKGGGKDTTAQGSVDINDIDARSIHSTALEQAELYMQSRLK